MSASDRVYLHDIRGLDAIPWWPLAPGWWLVVSLCLALLVVVTTWYWWARRDPLLPLYRDARRSLKGLRRRVRRDSVKDIASVLSELLRRIAMLGSERQDCAGLSGRAWLEWLAVHDPNGFDWTNHGQLLLVAPYAPDAPAVKRRQVRKLIDAALAWVDTSERSGRSNRPREPDAAQEGPASV